MPIFLADRPPRGRLRVAHPLFVALAFTACSADPPGTDEASQELSAPALSTLVTGVGATPEGNLAVRFNNTWFSLQASATSPWDVTNSVAATEIGVAPTDTSVTTDDCECHSADPGRPCTRSELIQQCGGIISTPTDETRTYSRWVGPSQYQVKALQTRHNERAIVASTGLRLGFSADMRFEINVVTPGQP